MDQLDYGKIKTKFNLEVHPEFNKENVVRPDGTSLRFKLDCKIVLGNELIWWTCSMKHPYSMTLKDRERGRGCPYCSGTKTLTGFNDVFAINKNLKSEWAYELNKKYALGPDGTICEKTIDPLKTNGGSFIRVWWKCNRTKITHFWKTPIVKRAKFKTGCPVCCGRKFQKGVNDLFSIAPDLKLEWDFLLNSQGSTCPDGSVTRKTLDPEYLPANSTEIAWWKCTKDSRFIEHSYSSPIFTKTREKRKKVCSICQGSEIRKGINDLATLRPDIVNEWSPNNTVSPSNISLYSGNEIFLICEKHGEWKTSPRKRAKGERCEKCPKIGSSFERIVNNWVLDQGLFTKTNSKPLKQPEKHRNKEVDILVLGKNKEYNILAIEVNDFRTHSINSDTELIVKAYGKMKRAYKSGPTYHEAKRALILDQLNIPTLFIWENEILDGSGKHKLILELQKLNIFNT